ncbi:MAG: phage terminase small subunit-related protein [Candidatus Gastranaerophilales bacterium]|nr:phage terminase small subunit-related protein [Candidatus Gastranaerophilales bacterium]
MTKKDTYEVIASQYFIEMQMSVAQIAKRLNLSEKTVHNWKKEGAWDDKKKKFLKSQYSTNQTLYELLHLVSKQAVEDYKTEGILPDQKTLYFIMGMTDKLAKLKTYENQTAQEKVEETIEKEPQDKTGITEDVLNKVFAKIIGE